jgi:hypothetical protein
MVIDYREAFDEWLKLDPLNNPSATPGPAYMPGYKNPNLEEAEQLNTEAEELFTEGTEAGEMAGKYVRQTVLFALVLFLIAAGQRFTQRPVRISANALAVCLLIYTLGYLTTCLSRREEVRIWTAQRTYITALRHSGRFTETRSGFYGTTEWAEFTIPRDQWSPGDRCEAGQQHDRRAEGGGCPADGPVPRP